MGSSTHDMLMTITTAVAAGVMLVVIARRLNLPSIVVLLIGGILLGSKTGVGLVDPDTLGAGLPVIVSMSVGLILFEGGLTLDLGGYRSAQTMIRRLLTIGVLITWVIGTAAIMLIVGVDFPYAVLAASLVIVTGPTVIAPLLKRIKVNPKIHGILHWEGVLIDPIGVFIAVLCYEWVIELGGQMAIISLLVRVGWGLTVGVIGGFTIGFAVKRRLVPQDMINVFALGFAVLVFAIAESVRSEAGLLAVTAAGFVFGLTGPSQLKQVRLFKAEITDLLIGTLFVLLAARLEVEQFKDFGLAGVAVVAVMLFVARPLSVLVCSWRCDLTKAEKAFLSWVAPRGIVAASMASLFAISMAENQAVDDPRFIETFVYSVIIVTIVLQGSTAGPLARWLGIRRPEQTGWMIVGAHTFGRGLARFLARIAGRQVVMVDTNAGHVRAARQDGVPAMVADARETSLAERLELQGVGNLLALTDNEDLNVRLCQIWAELYGSDHVWRCQPGRAEKREQSEQAVGRVVWPALPPPTIISRELDRGDARWRDIEGAPSSAMMRSILFALIGDELLVAPDQESMDQAGEELRAVALRRLADYLARSMHPDLIVTLDATERRAITRTLVELIESRVHGLPVEETIALVEGESAYAAFGNGVAVLHTTLEAVGARVCALARLKQGIDFGATDEQPVTLVFLLLGPVGDPDGHLATLAEIARLMSDETIRERIASAPSAEQVLRLVRFGVAG